MSVKELLESVRASLATIADPVSGVDLVSAGKVRELVVDEDGAVRFQFMLAPEDPGTLVREARAAAEGVPGVAKVKIDVRLPKPATQGGGGQGGGQGRQLRPGSVPAPTPEPDALPTVRYVIAVSSGKGGVGKSTVAVNLAAALAASGRKVGLLDADVYGPDIPLMFGETRRPQVTGQKGQEKIMPLEAHGVTLMSLGFLLDKEQPAIMRGPLVSGILRQFMEQVEWGEQDFLIVDMPPGTGDAQLSLAQMVEIDGVVMVTTPQDVSVGDVRRGIRMFERVKAPVIGIVENMSGYECPGCGHHADIFGKGGGEALAAEMGLPFLGAVPLDVAVRIAGDEGAPTALSAADSPAGRALRDIAERVAAAVEEAVATGA
jgi:ATP-binding protein involved in chromosome partitioning